MSKTALVVDDSLTIRKLVSQTLKKIGFEVVEAANGLEALNHAKTAGLDLVITDLNMPVMDGLEFVRALRKEAAHKFTPVVFLTTEMAEDRKADARDAGATGWIVKPFHPDKIMSVVQRIIG